MKYPNLCTAALLFIVGPVSIVAVTWAQEPKEVIEVIEVIEVADVVDVVEPNTNVILIINSDDMSKMLVVDEQGEWLYSARKIVITFDLVHQEKPQLECVMYKGLFPPPQPEIKIWGLTAIVNANDEEFQKLLIDLQDGSYNNSVE